MGKIVLGWTMSIDGYINDRNGGTELLYPDLDILRYTEPLKEAIQNTGAVIMGRKSFAMAEDPDELAGNYEFQVPIFVLTHHPPKKKPKETDHLTFTFVTDGIESAVQQAREAAGNKDIAVIGGGSTAHQCIKAGFGDVLQIDIMPVWLGGGLRPFEGLGADRIKLERTKVVELPNGRTHLEFRVLP